MSKSGDLSAKVIYEAMKLIDKNGGAMPLSDLYNNIEKNVSFTGFESDILSITNLWNLTIEMRTGGLI